MTRMKEFWSGLRELPGQGWLARIDSGVISLWQLNGVDDKELAGPFNPVDAVAIAQMRRINLSPQEATRIIVASLGRLYPRTYLKILRALHLPRQNT